MTLMQAKILFDGSDSGPDISNNEPNDTGWIFPTTILEVVPHSHGHIVFGKWKPQLLAGCGYFSFFCRCEGPYLMVLIPERMLFGIPNFKPAAQMLISHGRIDLFAAEHQSIYSWSFPGYKP